MVPERQVIESSISKVEKWVENNSYKGYEPFDGLNSFLLPLTFSSLFAERVLLQVVRRCPVNLRPLLGIKPQDSRIGRGYMASGYLKMLKSTGNMDYKEKAVDSLDWLIRNKAPAYKPYTWGYTYNFTSRSGRVPIYEPIIVWTSLIGQAFLDAYEYLEDKKYLQIADSICDWILALPREVTSTGTCISYVAYEQTSIHNSNMLGAAMLARTAIHTGNKEALRVARDAMEYSCSRQLPNGAWYYGEESKNHWIDNFHTAYNLDSLKCYIENTNDDSFDDNLRLGFSYFKNTFFERNGRPKYYHNRVYPIDIQCASQAIDTLAYFSDYDDSSLACAINVADWTINNMQDRRGYFHYRQLPLIKNKTPMLHWGQATMHKALAHLLSKLR